MDEILQAMGQAIAYLVAAPVYLMILAAQMVGRYLCRRTAIPRPSHVFITGATSGIGYGLALHYAKMGGNMPVTGQIRSRDASVNGRHPIRISITGRNAALLAKVKEDCEEIGAQVTTYCVDVTDKDKMKACIYEADDISPLDLVIANAGIFEGIAGVDALDDLEKASYAIADVNIYGVMNTVLPAVACMRSRKQGQIAITSSICAHAPCLPITPTYAASKIWELSWGLGLRANLWSTGIRFNLLCPGFVDTKMPRSVPSIRNGVQTGAPARGEDLPFIVSPAKIAAIFADGLMRDQAVIIYPSILYVLGSIIYKAPWPIQDFLMRNVKSGTGLLGNVFGHTAAAQAPARPDRKKEE